LPWFDRFSRDLPWRNPRNSDNNLPDPWAVLVSEIMLQQTPVDRVLPVWDEWLRRWPTPADLAEAPVSEAIRAWGRLGYPRRAIRLHAASVAIVRDHQGCVPATEEQLRALPGVGEYTALAVLAFAFGEPRLPLDVNVRRVLARFDGGIARPSAHITAAERAAAQRLIPSESGARWAAAVMELGALVCTASNPRCHQCPVSAKCAWRAADYPDDGQPVRKQPTYEGSDRQARGALLAVLRDSSTPVAQRRLDLAWPDPPQRARALAGLIEDGLVEPLPRRRYQLPR
jgi:A/G-specific adenine glycosylase